MPPAGLRPSGRGVDSLARGSQGRPVARSHREAHTSSREGGRGEQRGGAGGLGTRSAGGGQSAGHRGADRQGPSCRGLKARGRWTSAAQGREEGDALNEWDPRRRSPWRIGSRRGRGGGQGEGAGGRGQWPGPPPRTHGRPGRTSAKEQGHEAHPGAPRVDPPPLGGWKGGEARSPSLKIRLPSPTQGDWRAPEDSF